MSKDGQLLQPIRICRCVSTNENADYVLSGEGTCTAATRGKFEEERTVEKLTETPAVNYFTIYLLLSELENNCSEDTDR